MFFYVFSPPKPYMNTSTLHSVSHVALKDPLVVPNLLVLLVMLCVLKSITLQTIHKLRALSQSIKRDNVNVIREKI